MAEKPGKKVPNITQANPVIKLGYPAPNPLSMPVQRASGVGVPAQQPGLGFMPAPSDQSLFKPKTSKTLLKESQPIAMSPSMASNRSSSYQPSTMATASIQRAIHFDDRGTYLKATPLMMPNVDTVVLYRKRNQEPLVVDINDLEYIMLRLKQAFDK